MARFGCSVTNDTFPQFGAVYTHIWPEKATGNIQILATKKAHNLFAGFSDSITALDPASEVWPPAINAGRVNMIAWLRRVDIGATTNINGHVIS